jgi:hypothetical protein
MSLTRVKKTASRYKDYDQKKRHTNKRPYLYTTVITQESLRTIL